MSTDFDYSSIGKTSQRIQADATTTTKSNSSLDQSDFLKLLTTQLTNQDPSSPVDNNQMVTTMSQLSMVDNLNSLAKSVDGVTSLVSSSSALTASSLVGREVLLSSGDGYFSGVEGDYMSAQIDAGDGATDVVVRVIDSNDNEVARFTAGSISGKVEFDWNGKNEETGEYYPAGSYKIEAVGLQSSGYANLSVKPYAKVASVTLGSDLDSTMLNLVGYNQQIAVSKVGDII